MERSFPLESITNDSICMEIGVWKGHFSKQILSKKPKRLYLVDPWLYQDPEIVGNKWYSGIAAKKQQDMDDIYYNNVWKFACREDVDVRLIKGKSDDILPLLPENHFDWVYIDGNHEYDFVYRDLINCLRLVKNGGFITGDDVLWPNDDGILTVKKALEQFVKDYKQNCTVKDGQFVIKVVK
jgi:hypothetical protein